MGPDGHLCTLKGTLVSLTHQDMSYTKSKGPQIELPPYSTYWLSWLLGHYSPTKKIQDTPPLSEKRAGILGTLASSQASSEPSLYPLVLGTLSAFNSQLRELQEEGDISIVTSSDS